MRSSAATMREAVGWVTTILCSPSFCSPIRFVPTTRMTIMRTIIPPNATARRLSKRTSHRHGDLVPEDQKLHSGRVNFRHLREIQLDDRIRRAGHGQQPRLLVGCRVYVQITVDRMTEQGPLVFAINSVACVVSSWLSKQTLGARAEVSGRL